MVQVFSQFGMKHENSQLYGSGHVPKMLRKNLAYIKFGENLSICSQDIERKQNSGINQGS